MSVLESVIKKRVLIVCPGGLNSQGGVGRIVRNFTEAWKELDSPPSYEVLDSRGVQSLWLSPIYFFYTICRILGKYSCGDVRLLHLHMSSYGSAVRKTVLIGLGNMLRIPIVLHLHGGAFHIFYRNLPRLFQRIIQWAFQHVQIVIVLGPSWKNFIHNELGIGEERIVIMPNAVSIPLKQGTRSSHSQIQLLFLGRLASHKGVSILLRALASSNVKTLKWKAIFAGDGNIKTYQEEAEQLGVKERISFPGWVSGTCTNELLMSSDIMILPSLMEGLPMAILEGMAYGLAVIATSVGSIPEVITHNENGLLISPSDDEELAKAVERLITDFEFRHYLSKNARQRVVEQFGIQSYALKMNEVYQESVPLEAKR